MKTFDKYPLYAPERDEATAGTHAPEKRQGKVAKTSTRKRDDDDDIDAVDGADNNKKAHNEPSKANSDDPQEPTRGKMASVFISGFFMIIMVCFIYAAWQQASLSEVKDMVIAVIGALSGLVGFVIGYYFKTTAKS